MRCKDNILSTTKKKNNLLISPNLSALFSPTCCICEKASLGQLLSVLLFTAEGLAQQEHMLLKDGAGVGLLIASSRVARAAWLITLDKINPALLACYLTHR